VVAEVLEARPEYRIVPVEGILDTLAERGVVTAEGRERLRTATEGPFLRTVPGVHPCDGFFAAVVEKAGEMTEGRRFDKEAGGCRTSSS
jgi:16S rRNA (cytosine967-C5)-methyltransferase